MKVHTNRFKEEISSFGRQIDSIITYKLNGVTQTLTSENLNGVTPTYQGAILKSVMKQLDVDSNIDIPIGTSLNYKFGVLVDGSFEYLNFGNYIVFSSEKQEDTRSYKLTCYDKMLFSMLDNVDLGVTYPISVRDYLKALCNKLGLVFKNANDNFVNYNRMIKKELYVGLEYTFRDIFDELAQVTASTICLNENDEVELRYISNTAVDTIDEGYLKDININFGEKYGPINSIVLSRSGESDNVYLQDEESVQANGLCELKIVDNQIMNWNDRSDYLPEILEQLDGLEYYINDFVSTGIAYLDLCDRYNVKIGDNTYSCIMLNDELEVTQGLVENIHTDMPEETKTDYTKADKTDRKINQTYLIVDKQNQTIESVVSQTTEQNKKIAKISQTVDELNSKISDMADITTSGESSYGSINLAEVNESEPIAIKVHPIEEDISYLYPSDFLYPSDDLYSKSRTIRFTNTKTNEIFDLELPDDLLYYDNEHYDEFILNYDSQTFQVIKRVGYDIETNKNVLLPKEKIINYEYVQVPLTSGDYTIELLGYTIGYIYCQLMASNIYTTQFATKVELSSSISQTKEEINLEVSKKVGKNEVISSINLTSEAATIQASKVNISGVINAINNNTSTTINGNKITTGTITANQVSSDIITTTNFSAQNINANKITSGTLSTDRLESKVITTDNFSAQNINADKITAGTLSAANISLKNVRLTPTSSKIGGWTINSNQLLSSNSTGNSTINANGEIYFYPTKGGILGLNNAFRCKGPNGIAIYNDKPNYGTSDTINAGISIMGDSGNVTIGNRTSANSVNIRSYCSESTRANPEGRCILLASASNTFLWAGGQIWAEGNNLANSKVKTDAGSSSSRNVKTNFKKFNQEKYDKALSLLNKMDLYDYDYKYNIYKNPHKYGFIIDELEEYEETKDFFEFEEYNATVDGEKIDFSGTQKGTQLKTKNYDSDVLDKYMLTCIKALQNKIEVLENRIKELESDK